ncbi:MAG TPA: M24 family metallopeptidase [Bacteroidota bacterium]|nr:M24 family metallopeptidase [Bacteroidota bacterium]
MSTATALAQKISHIQERLRELKLDGWLMYNFRGTNIFASKILEIPPDLFLSRRFFYFIPAQGTPRKLVHGIEAFALDHLPGEKAVYGRWPTLHEGVKNLLAGASTVAMEYSPNNAIPYLSKVDAGTIEFIRGFGVDIVSSGNIVQYFEARWDDEQYQDMLETAHVLRQTVDVAFSFIGDELRAGRTVTEYDVQQKMLEYFHRHGIMTSADPNCSVNGNGANPHYEPTKDRFSAIHKGDYVLIDLWAKKNKPGSVYADITWIAYAGDTIPEKYQQVFDVVKGSRDAAVDFLKKEMATGSKVTGCSVDDVTRAYIDTRGYGEYFIHRTGHNIGEEVHGNGANIDNFETHDDRELIPQTCFSIEPGVYLPGEFGVRSEIDVYISADREVIIPGLPIQQEIVKIVC